MNNKEEVSKYFKLDDGSPSHLSRISGKHLTSIRGGYYSVRVNHKCYRIHRLIMILLGHDIDGKVIDHLNRNKLDNCPSNLRVVTRTQNSRNCKIWSNNKTGVTGVSRNRFKNHWYYIASWKEDNKLFQRRIGVELHGDEVAFKLACDCRREAMHRLKDQGYGYTDEHGF